MSLIVYIFGPPAIGKSLLMSRLTGNCRRSFLAKPIPHTWLLPPGSQTPAAVELGCNRTAFPGVDCLPYDIHERACDYLKGPVPPLILAEGDRLANMKYWTFALSVGHHIHGIRLNADTDIIDARHRARGARQSRRWRDGRATKCSNLARDARAAGIDISDINAGQYIDHVVYDTVWAEPALEGLAPVELRAEP